jgi:hypothetical protein
MPADAAVLLLALAILFVALTVHDVLRTNGTLTPSRKTWLRLAMVFAAVAIGLQVVRLLLG